MAVITDPVEIALTEMGEDELFAKSLVGQLPKLDEHQRVKCGWLVHLDEEGKIQHLSFHSTDAGVEVSPEDDAELRDTVRQLPYQPGFDAIFIIDILKQAKARTAAFLVELVHDQTLEAIWVLYYHPVLDPELAMSLVRLSLNVVEADESEARFEAEMAELGATLDSALGLEDLSDHLVEEDGKKN